MPSPWPLHDASGDDAGPDRLRRAMVLAGLLVAGGPQAVAQPAPAPSPRGPTSAPSTGGALGTVALWLSAEGAGYTALAESFRAEWSRSGATRVSVVTPDGSAAEGDARKAVSSDAQLLVTVGVEATRQALALDDPRLPILAVLVPRVAFDEMLATARPKAGRRVSAVFIDQPLARQLDLIKLAVPRASKLAVIAGPGALREPERLAALAQSRSLELAVEQVTRSGEIYPALQRCLRGADALLVMPDPDVVNAASAQNVLLTSYRLRVPVLGYSASYVRAGALVGVYSTPEQQGVEAAEWARQALRGQALPPPRQPRLFDVAVNQQVARALGLTALEGSALRDQLLRLERDGSTGG